MDHEHEEVGQLLKKFKFVNDRIPIPIVNDYTLLSHGNEYSGNDTHTHTYIYYYVKTLLCCVVSVC